MFSRLKYLSFLGLFIVGNLYAQAPSHQRLDVSIGGTKTANNVNQIDFPEEFVSATQTARKATLSFKALSKWKVGAVEGTGTVNIVGTGTVILSATTDGNGNGTITVTGTTTPNLDQVAVGTSTMNGNGTGNFTGTVSAGGFSGDGSGLTNITATLFEGTGNDQYTKLLLHGDQVGSLSSYLDSSEQEGTVTAIGSINGTTTHKVFGSSSFSFDGLNDRLSCTDSSRLELGSNDFMLETRVRFLATTYTYLMSKEQAASTDYILFGYNADDSKLYLDQKASSAFVVQTFSGSWTPSLNTWYHVAVIRKGSRFRFYVDGSQIGADVLDTDAIVDNTAGWMIGSIASDSNCLNGYLDEIRISIGTGRKSTGTFTVAAEPYGSFTTTLSN